MTNIIKYSKTILQFGRAITRYYALLLGSFAFASRLSPPSWFSKFIPHALDNILTINQISSKLNLTVKFLNIIYENYVRRTYAPGDIFDFFLGGGAYSRGLICFEKI